MQTFAKKLLGRYQYVLLVLAAGVLLLLYGVGRNVLMIRFGIDPLGDLGYLWNGIAKTGLY